MLLRKLVSLVKPNILKKVMPCLVNNSEKRLASILKFGIKKMANMIFNSKMKRNSNLLEKS